MPLNIIQYKICKVKCPICNNETPATILSDQSDSYGKYYICKCQLCERLFFLHKATMYEYKQNKLIATNDIEYIFPYSNAEKVFSATINQISNSFETLYNQASIVENIGLTDISGLAYRRAFEFLLRDFVCFLYPEKAEAIKSDNNFSNVVKNRLPNDPIYEDIKELSLRAWWIGSDYAHYDKKYESVDIDDLKQIIDILTALIELIIKTNKYKQITKR